MLHFTWFLKFMKLINTMAAKTRLDVYGTRTGLEGSGLEGEMVGRGDLRLSTVALSNSKSKVDLHVASL